MTNEIGKYPADQEEPDTGGFNQGPFVVLSGPGTAPAQNRQRHQHLMPRPGTKSSSSSKQEASQPGQQRRRDGQYLPALWAGRDNRTANPPPRIIGMPNKMRCDIARVAVVGGILWGQFGSFQRFHQNLRVQGVLRITVPG